MDIKVLSLPVNVQLDPGALDWGTQRELRGVSAPQRHGGLWKDGIGEKWHIRISAPVLQRKRFFQKGRDLGRRVPVRSTPYSNNK